MLRTLTLKAAGKIGRHWQASDWEIRAYAYSLQVLFLDTFQYFLYIGISIVVGLFQPTIIMLAGFIGFRTFAGSLHLKTFPRCLFFTGLTLAMLLPISVLKWFDSIRYGVPYLHSCCLYW